MLDPLPVEVSTAHKSVEMQDDDQVKSCPGYFLRRLSTMETHIPKALALGY